MMNSPPHKSRLHSYQEEVKPVDDCSPFVTKLHLRESLRILSKQQRIEFVFVELFCQIPLQFCLEAGMMTNLRRQEDSPIQIADVIPIHVAPAADAQAHAS